MAASRWSQSSTYNFNVLLLKQHVSPISRCINQNVRVPPLARIGAGCTIYRVANGRLRTAVPRIKRERTLHIHDLTPPNIAASQHILRRHETELVYEELDKNIVTFHLDARDACSCGIVDTRTSFTSLGTHSSSPGGDARIAFSAEQREDGVKTELPRDCPTPAQLSFVLLKLREEVCLRLKTIIRVPI